MKSLYASPLRVYIILIGLSLLGIWSGLSLPISLYPNSSKPLVRACIGYDMSADTLFRSFGKDLESQLQNINTSDVKVDRMTATYDANQVCYRTEFTWGSSDRLALHEVRTIVYAASGAMPYTSRQRTWVNSSSDNEGFLALSFFSNKRSLTEIYKILDPILTPEFAKVLDAQSISICNPQPTQVSVELQTEALAGSWTFARQFSWTVLT